MRILNKYLKSSIVYIIGLFFITQVGSAQVNTTLFNRVDSLSKSRFVGMMSTALSGTCATIGLLSNEWYSEYDKVSFHFFNDNNEWLQMDKLGHGLTAFYGGVYGYNALKWTGLNERTSIWLGGTYGFSFLLATEIMDGFSSGWGASKGDLIANGLGTSLFLGQQLYYGRQIITPKFSFWPSEFSEFRPELLGDNNWNRWLKDYNGQVYWLSFSLSDFGLNKKFFPKWLSLAFGYGGNGMLGGEFNPLINEKGNALPDFKRERELFLSFDLNFQSLTTKSPLINTLIKGVSFFKIPFPTLKFSSSSTKILLFH